MVGGDVAGVGESAEGGGGVAAVGHGALTVC